MQILISLGHSWLNEYQAAAIGQGVYKRGLEGNASAPNAKVFGESAKMCADISLSFLRDYEDMISSSK